MIKIYRRFIGLILALAFVTVMFFGLSMGMDMQQDGTMSGCAFDSSVTCPMDYQEHIKHWQQTFTSTQPTRNIILVLLIMIVLGGDTALFFSSFLKLQRYAQEAHYLPQTVRRQREITSKLSDHILQALSNGILNPRLYNFSKAIRCG